MVRRLFFVFVLLAGAAIVTDTVLEACGSKFLVGTRAARYQRLQAAMNPSAILFYWEQDENTPDEDKWNPELQELLEKVGHTVEVTFDFNAFRSAARAGEFNIAVLELDRARELRADLQLLSPDMTILPVALFPTRPEFSKAKREFGQVLKMPSTVSSLLSVLDKSAQGTGP